MSASIERAIRSGTAGQDGVATRAQLVAAGVSRRTIERRVASGELVSLSTSVVGLPDFHDRDRQRMRAALLAVDGSVLGFDTAGRLHGLPLRSATSRSRVHLVVPHGWHHRQDGVRVHQTRKLSPIDRSSVTGLGVTTPARTLVDLAAQTPTDRFRWLTESAIKEGIVSASALRACIAQFDRSARPGVARAFETVESLFDEPVDRSELERRFARVVASAGLDDVVEQFQPPWYDGVRGIVDFAVPAQRIVIEVDGRRWHSLTQDMDSDRRRDRLAAMHGWVVIRFTWDEVVHRSSEVVSDITTLVARRSRAAA